MEDSIEVILQDQGSDRVLQGSEDNAILTASTGALLTGLYGLWSLFTLPGFRKVPKTLKDCFNHVDWEMFRDLSDDIDEYTNMVTGFIQKCMEYVVPIETVRVPYLPSSKDQTQNIMRLLEGRRGRLADLGSGDGRLVFAACCAGFQCTGFEINSMLLAYARGKAYWRGLSPNQATFVNKDFWKTDLSHYNNVTLFLAPGVMEMLGEKLLKELPDDARVVACRFPITGWPYHSSMGSGLGQTWAYDISSVRSSLGSL